MMRTPIPALLLFFLLVPVSCKSGHDQPPESSLGQSSVEQPSAAGSDAEQAAISWSEPVILTRGPAERGPWRMNRSRFHYVDDASAAFFPAAETTGSKEPHELGVVWVDNKKQNVFFQRYSSATGLQGESVDVSRSGDTFSWLPRVQIHQPGPGAEPHVYVLWQEIVFSGGSHGGEAFFARSIDGGETFEAAQNLSNSINGDGKGRLTSKIWDNGSLDLVVASDGTLIAAWTDYEGSLYVSRSVDHGASFSAPNVVAGSSLAPARGPALAAASDRRVAMAWTVGESDDADVHYAWSDDVGDSWSRPRAVNESTGHSDAPALAYGPDDTLHLVYAESPSGMFQDYGIRYAREGSPGVGFDSVSWLRVPPESNQLQGHFPQLEVSPDNGVFVLWEHFDSAGDRRPNGLMLAYSGDGGEQFSEPALVAGSAHGQGFNGSLQGLLGDKLAVSPRCSSNSDCAVAVVNSRFEPGQESVVVLVEGALE